MISVALVCLTYLIYNKVKTFFFFIYFLIINILTILILITNGKFFIGIIIGLIFITAYSFLIILLIMGDKSPVVFKIISLGKAFVIIISIVFITLNSYFVSWSLLHTKETEATSDFLSLYYSIIPNIYFYKFYILLILLFFFTLVIIIKLFK